MCLSLGAVRACRLPRALYVKLCEATEMQADTSAWCGAFACRPGLQASHAHHDNLEYGVIVRRTEPAEPEPSQALGLVMKPVSEFLAGKYVVQPWPILEHVALPAL